MIVQVRLKKILLDVDDNGDTARGAVVVLTEPSQIVHAVRSTCPLMTYIAIYVARYSRRTAMLKERFIGGPTDLAVMLYHTVALLFFHGETEIGNGLILDD
ncbi:hypothetical protein M405DRAFT_843408 [Rhizopogon salebrosus TDB-379]|nr:hypothetical protein M405DRAFT_843408 [Rhizopogon salebrosus TDB-379]